MSKMGDLLIDIEEHLDNTTLSCEEIATKLNVPIEWIHQVIEDRWKAIIGEAEYT